MRQRTALLFLVASLLFLTVLFPAGAHAETRETETFINAHEHIESIELVPAFLEAMHANGIKQTVIVGSPDATFRQGETGFFGQERNNREILKIAKTYPEDFIAFPTIDVQDPEKLDKLRRYLNQGGKGLKLYGGNRRFHSLPLDHESMAPVYAYCEDHQIPVLFHVNAGYYLGEFENVLKRFGQLKVICPHFCLSTIATGRFESLMDSHPNLYTDISFGPMDYLKAGMLRLSRDSEKYRGLVIRYQDRIFFGTDMVVVHTPEKTTAWMVRVTRGYRDMLEKKTYTFFLLEGVVLKGLHLEPPILEKIYRTNFERFFNQTKPHKTA